MILKTLPLFLTLDRLLWLSGPQQPHGKMEWERGVDYLTDLYHLQGIPSLWGLWKIEYYRTS